MAAALSYLNFLVRRPGAGKMLAICASTGDTSAAAALYAAYLGDKVASAVLLPHGKVTPQQLAQPLGSGARVLEIPGVFDDCMKVVEALADNYQVALLNSKNPWRIRGQESYAYEIAQWFDYDLAGKVVVVPIGNAGNITAIMQGFLRLHDLGIIETLPRIIGVQSRHANPVFRYYLEPDKAKRVFTPVTVHAQRGPGRHDRQPGVHAPGHPPGGGIPPPGRGGQRRGGPGERAGDHGLHAAGQPPRPHRLHPGGRIPGGLPGGPGRKAGGLQDEVAVLDATAHHLKFIGFQQMYFENTFPPEFEVTPKPEYQNRPQLLTPQTEDPAQKTADLAGQIAALAGIDPEEVRQGCRHPGRSLIFSLSQGSSRKGGEDAEGKVMGLGAGSRPDVGVPSGACAGPRTRRAWIRRP